MTSPDLLNVPLSEDEETLVADWLVDAHGATDLVRMDICVLKGKTPDQAALAIRMDYGIDVRDRDVMKAAGREVE